MLGDGACDGDCGGTAGGIGESVREPGPEGPAAPYSPVLLLHRKGMMGCMAW